MVNVWSSWCTRHSAYLWGGRLLAWRQTFTVLVNATALPQWIASARKTDFTSYQVNRSSMSVFRILVAYLQSWSAPFTSIGVVLLGFTIPGNSFSTCRRWPKSTETVYRTEVYILAQKEKGKNGSLNLARWQKGRVTADASYPNAGFNE